MDDQMENTRCGFAVFFGKPNAGKSTLVNRLLGYNLSVVNHKVQTTRNKILGVLTEGNTQIIFNDTPGVITPKYELQNFMMMEIEKALDGADVIMHLIDAAGLTEDNLKEIQEKYGEILKDERVITILNKTDLLKQEEVLKTMLMCDNMGFKTPIPVSAAKGANIDVLKQNIISRLPESPFYYDVDTVTDRPERFFVGEIIRGKILTFFHQEIPYSVFVNITDFKEREGRKDYISAEIILERETQKAIIIGRSGESLKKLGQAARKEIEKFLDREVYLELFVKVRKDWRSNTKFLKDNF